MKITIKKVIQWIKRHVTITNEWKDIKDFGDVELVSVYVNVKFKFITVTLSNFRINIWL